MLLRIERTESQFLSGFERRQLVFQFLIFLVFAFFRFFVDFEEAVELQDRSRHAEPECFRTGLGININRGLIEDSRRDLRGHETLPDQFVNLELVFL